jgi:acid phosphatase
VDITNLRLNETYSGPESAGEYSKYSPTWPVPLTDGKCSAGNGILDIVKKTYAGHAATYNYSSPYPWDTKSDYNTKVTITRKNATNTTSTTLSASSTATKGAAAAIAVPGSTVVTGALVAIFAYLL